MEVSNWQLGPRPNCDVHARASRSLWACPGFVDTDREADTVSTMDEAKQSKRQRRSFTDEFKASAVRLVLDEGKTITQVARDLDLTASALRQWVERARADRSQGKTGLTSAEREEYARLKKENRELRMEREILKKAAVSSVGQRNTW